MHIDEADERDSPQHLKQVSRIKHLILQKYLPAWERILGSHHKRLCYFDCYAGPGVYEFEGKKVDGSSIIAVWAAKGYLARSAGKEMNVILVERNDRQRASLEKELNRCQPYPQGLHVYIYAEDVREFVPKVLEHAPNLAPSFFMVDPYGHPLTIPILNQILGRPRMEALITFMYYRINMDAGNPMVQSHLDEMFGSDIWRNQQFLKERGQKREQGFLKYFIDQISASFKLPFRIRFDVEDGVAGSRTKYYLIHASNHPKAALLMKEVMWPLGDEEGIFDFSGEKCGVLFSSSPREEELKEFIMRTYNGKKTEFDRLRQETWELPYIEKHYRSVIKRLKQEGLVEIQPVTSKSDRGLKGSDRIFFNPRVQRDTGGSR
jgi:three-Cys-motif partner protein